MQYIRITCEQTKKLCDYYRQKYDVWDEAPFKGFKDFNEQLVKMSGDDRK